jgi:UDP-glucose 4-epimerase
MDFIRVDIRNPLVARVIESTKSDTIVHTNITSSPARVGGRSQMKENNVIGTMQLLAAAQRAERIKKVVMRSSTAVYGSAPGDPSLLPEDQTAGLSELAGYGKDCAEAETYTRDFARRRPDVDVTILRAQSVVGPTVRTGMTDYLALPVIPTALGFDPRIQLLHEVDAIEAMCRAVFDGPPGIFNISADGVVYLSQVIRLLGRAELPLPLPIAVPTANLFRRFKLVDFPADQLSLILFGRVVDNTRARNVLGFSPSFTTRDTVKDLRDRTEHDDVGKPRKHPAWERELFDYLDRRDLVDR